MTQQKTQEPLPELGKVTLRTMQELRDLGLLAQSGQEQLTAQIGVYIDEDKLRRLIDIIYLDPPKEDIQNLDLKEVGRDLKRFLLSALGG
jgi:hypothetical protein